MQQFKPLILMYLYFDSMGEIKAITPSPDFDNKFKMSTFPLSEVEGFLTGEKNPFEFFIKEIERAGKFTYKISRKESKVPVVRSLSNYLTKVEPIGKSQPIIRIINDVVRRGITVKIDSYFTDLLKHGSEEEIEMVNDFANAGPSTLYFTKRNNPYHFLHRVIFHPKDLCVNGSAFFEYNNVDLSQSSVYTKKIAKTYGYLIKGT